MWCGVCCALLLLLAVLHPVFSVCEGTFLGCPDVPKENSTINGESNIGDNDQSLNTTPDLDAAEIYVSTEIIEEITSGPPPTTAATTTTAAATTTTAAATTTATGAKSTSKSSTSSTTTTERTTTTTSPTIKQSEVTTTISTSLPTSITKTTDIPVLPTSGAVETAGFGSTIVIVLGVVASVGIILSAVFAFLYFRNRKLSNSTSQDNQKQEAKRPSWRNSDEVRKMLTDDDRFVP
ncbi:uncharacterized protein [Anabrus simplex]|uniref:uncharacterized protein n=1 Tax=Anabrus simplex TaxID=316456 RepID=UPI0035A30020